MRVKNKPVTINEERIRKNFIFRTMIDRDGVIKKGN